ncbi:hypothetical protein [Kamptonema sp. UHCC 0994]|uniref:hypothetical protein n=1 Tax=Kamptonema sp. UHCC 0994 TaxID=3031329 RepID=UPI0023BA038C|nr:hypothetical protein [Kamptonema sp. UHCC 0994]MDF0552200.1 hypothetical protein [Kamptonema sp. UHCC 0994]
MVAEKNALSEVYFQIGSLFATERLERVKSERFLIVLLVFTLSKLQERRDFKESLFEGLVDWLNTGGW